MEGMWKACATVPLALIGLRWRQECVSMEFMKLMDGMDRAVCRALEPTEPERVTSGRVGVK